MSAKPGTQYPPSEQDVDALAHLLSTAAPARRTWHTIARDVLRTGHVTVAATEVQS